MGNLQLDPDNNRAARKLAPGPVNSPIARKRAIAPANDPRVPRQARIPSHKGQEVIVLASNQVADKPEIVVGPTSLDKVKREIARHVLRKAI